MTTKVLLVDDDPALLAGLVRRLRRNYTVETAADGAAGLAALQRGGPFAVVISDMRMPGLDGAQFLARVKAAAPDCVRIMLTGQSDVDTAMRAVNDGAIFRFLTKPCATETLTQAIDAGLKQYQLVTAERVLLSRTLLGSIRVLTDVLSLLNPVAFGRAARVQRLVRELCANLRVEAAWEIDMAAMLSQIGCVTLPPHVFEKLHRGAPLTPDEETMVARHPEIGASLVARIPRLEGVAAIIAAQNTPYDAAAAAGSAAQPPGARILKAASDYDLLVTRGCPAPRALVQLRARTGEYDPVVLAALGRIVQCAADVEIVSVTIRQMTEGMVLAEDIVTQSGAIVIAKGQEVTACLRERLVNYARHTPVKEPLHVIVHRPVPPAPRTPPSLEPLAPPPEHARSGATAP